MIIILFGLAGSGKNFVGKILEEKFNFYFMDADELLTDEMKACVAEHKPFEQPMRDCYTELVIQKIKDLHRFHENIAISKALYKEKNRHQMLNSFSDLRFIHIQSDSKIIAERVGTREHLINEDYANLISKGFETPSIPHAKIINNSDAQAIIQQLKKILEKK